MTKHNSFTSTPNPPPSYIPSLHPPLIYFITTTSIHIPSITHPPHLHLLLSHPAMSRRRNFGGSLTTSASQPAAQPSPPQAQGRPPGLSQSTLSTTDSQPPTNISNLPPGLSHPRSHARVHNADYEAAVLAEKRSQAGGGALNGIKGKGKGNGKGLGSGGRDREMGLNNNINKLSISSSQPSSLSITEQSPDSNVEEGGTETETEIQDDDLPPPFPTSDEESCFICAERVRFWSVGVCGHRTCQ
jgi:hypothetical protein